MADDKTTILSPLGDTIETAELEDNSVTIAKLGVPTTKGGLLSTDGTDVTELAIGANNLVLTADSTETTGMKWAETNEVIVHTKSTTTSTSEVELATTGSTTGTDGDIYQIDIFADRNSGTNFTLKLRLNDGTSDLDFTLATTDITNRNHWRLSLTSGTVDSNHANLSGFTNDDTTALAGINLTDSATLIADWLTNSHTISLRGNLGTAGTLGFIFLVKRIEV